MTTQSDISVRIFENIHQHHSWLKLYFFNHKQKNMKSTSKQTYLTGTPRYCWNYAKVGVKHQSINQSIVLQATKFDTQCMVWSNLVCMMCIWNTGTLKIIQVHSKSYRYTQNYTDIKNYTDTLKIIQIHSKSYRYTQNYTGTKNYTDTLKIIQIHSKLYRYTQNYTGTLKIIQVHSKSYRYTQNQKIGRQSNLKFLGTRKLKDLNRIVKVWIILT